MHADHASLCVLSFNRPQFIEETIKQLHSKSQHPFELIVHDDGSYPEVQKLLLDLNLGGYISTLILNQDQHNQGQGVALNRMFRMATGDPIVKLDQDLVFSDGWLRDAVGIMDANDRLGLLGLFHYHHEPVDSAKTLLARHEGWQEHTHICGSGFAVSRECWGWLGPFNEHSEAFAEDWEFQRAVTASWDYCCGLPDRDLVTNRGFGIGPSTVVVGPGKVQTINKEPVIFGR